MPSNISFLPLLSCVPNGIPLAVPLTGSFTCLIDTLISLLQHHCGLVVDKDERRAGTGVTNFMERGAVEVVKELTEPESLLGGQGQSNVLGLGAGLHC